MSTFVLEIGSEELPSRFLAGERRSLQEQFEKALNSAHLDFGDITVSATPRRAAVIITDLASVQSESEEEVVGPPARIAYDKEGQPTKALQGFLRTQGVGLSDLYQVTTEKGAYVATKKRCGGRSAKDLLSEICPLVVTSIPFAKSMRWGSYSLTSARPLHWIVALLDNEVVPFRLGPLESGRLTYGHRVHGKGPFEIAEASDYGRVLEEKGRVTLDGGARRALIIASGDRLASEVEGRVLWKESLLDEVEGLVEHPVPLLGSFDPAYLDVPAEVLLTSMESHQKSFGIAGPDGRLLPYFLTVANLDPADVSVVRKGWERVLHARLEDARFFWKEDLHSDFSDWLAKLDHVIFIGALGSMGEKTRRLKTLCAWLAHELFPNDEKLADHCARAGRLSKADLMSGMVGEFDSLQGIMGGIYAERKGEAKEVSEALREQYLPAGPESPVPSDVTGAILSMADKADTLAGCFGLNKIPSGTADPFALRRCALGIIRIIEHFGFRIDLGRLFKKAQELYGERKWKLEPEEALAKLHEFMRGRVSNYLQGQGLGVVLIEACLNAGMDDICDAMERIRALTTFEKQEDFVPAVQVMKRVVNILQKQGQDGVGREVDPDLFADDSERKLFSELSRLSPELRSASHAERLKTLSGLRPYVDNFFDQVMVLCEDAKIRENRIALLTAVHGLYASLADFSALQI